MAKGDHLHNSHSLHPVFLAQRRYQTTHILPCNFFSRQNARFVQEIKAAVTLNAVFREHWTRHPGHRNLIVDYSLSTNLIELQIPEARTTAIVTCLNRVTDRLITIHHPIGARLKRDGF